MIKAKSILLIFLSLSIHGAIWSQVSTKGNWTKEDKLIAIADLNVQREVFEAFLDSTQVDPLIDCIADNLEQSFENPEAVDTKSDTIQAISIHCLEAVGFNTNPTEEENTSVKGNWSEKDVTETFEMFEVTRPSMNEIMEPEKVDLLFDCIMTKLESNYANLDEALNDPENGISKMTTDCITENKVIEESELPEKTAMIKEEAGDPNSSVGNWSDADKTLLEEQLSELRPGFESRIGKEKTEIVLECVRFNFENAFENYADINNHPDVYKAILDECYSMGQ